MCSTRTFLLALLLIPAAAGPLAAQYGPGGVGSTDGASSLLLWLKADAITGLADGDTLSTWSDFSGRGHNATQSTSTLRPTYETDAGNAINGKPVVRFHADNVYLANSSFSHSGHFTTIAVYRTPSARTANLSKRIFSAPTSTAADNAGGIALMEHISGSISPKVNVTVNGSAATAKYAIGKRLNTNGSVVNGLNEFDGNVAELIVYNESLDYAQQVIIRNYLAGKYNIKPQDSKYSSSTHTVDVAGIGRSGASNTSAASAGLIVTDHGTLDADGKYYLFGHTSAPNKLLVSDLPFDVHQRWSRDWYIDQTGRQEGTGIKIAFDFSDGGISGAPASSGDYALLSRTGTSGPYAIINTGSVTISGDRVIFTLPDVNITDGYYTLGIVTRSGSNSEGNTSIVGPGGFSANDGTSTLALWLRADAITGVADGGTVGTWYDQSGNDHHATQNTPSLRPTFQNDAGNSINGFPVLRFYNDNTVLRNNSFVQNGNFTSLAVWSVPSARTGNLNKRVFSAPSAADSDQTAGLYAEETATGTVPAKLDVNWQSNSLRSTTRYAIGKYVAPDGTVTDGSYEFDGNLAELIIFNEAVSDVKRVILENYLSTKYAVACSDDKYTEPTSMYSYDVSGIGRSGEMISSAGSAGMVLSDNGALSDDGKYFIFGHNGATGISSSDLPPGVSEHWNREWYIDQTGWLNAGGINITFDYGDAAISDMPQTANNYRLLKRSLSSGLYQVVPTTASISGDRVTFTVSDANNIIDGYYTIGNSTADNLLPVDLSSFSARPDVGIVVLTWSTSIEMNNAGFIISRSLQPDSGFIPIASYLSTLALVGQGTKIAKTNYRYTDDATRVPGTRYYYRIQSVGTDGIAYGSSTLGVDIPLDEAITLFHVDANFPNPYIGSTTIPFTLHRPGQVRITIGDVEGRIIHSDMIEGQSGANKYLFDGRGLPPGIYWYQVTMGVNIRRRTMLIGR